MGLHKVWGISRPPAELLAYNEGLSFMGFVS